MFLDNAKNNPLEFNFLVWGDSYLAGGINSAPYLGVNTAVFGTSLDQYCIFGFTNLNRLHDSCPYYHFTLTANNVINLGDNSVSDGV